MITATTAKVWHSSEKGRRYLSRSKAIEAEARIIINRKYPVEHEHYDYERGGLVSPGWSLETDDPKRYAKMLRRMKRLIDKNTER